MSHLHFSEILMQLSDAAEQFKVFGNSKSVFTIQKGYKMQFLLLPNKDFTNKVCVACIRTLCFKAAPVPS